MIYIYAYENKINGKMYIGQTINIRKRNNAHKRSNKRTGIGAAINKYGIDNFNFFVLEVVYSIEQANQSEIFWIAEMRKFLGRNNIYNMTDGGGATSGFKHLEETKEKIRKSKENLSIETRQKMSDAQRRKLPISEETRKKMSFSKKGEKNINFGKPLSDDVKSKLSKIMSGENSPNFGKALSDETKKKISEAQLGSKNHMFGKHLLLSTKQKLSDRFSGEGNNKAKLTKNDVINIRELLKSNISMKEISIKFNVSSYTISDIKNYKTWKKLDNYNE